MIFVPRAFKKAAINFLFPHLTEYSKEYIELCRFIDSEFNKIQACVMYRFNSDFVKLLSRLGLEIDREEVIINGNYVFASSNYSYFLSIIEERRKV